MAYTNQADIESKERTKQYRKEQAKEITLIYKRKKNRKYNRK